MLAKTKDAHARTEYVIFTAFPRQQCFRKRASIVLYMYVDCLVSTLSHKRHEFRKTLLSIKRVLVFFTAFILNVCHYKKNSARYCHK